MEFGTFKLTSGKSSSYYIDLRVLPSYPEAFREICSFYIELIKKSIGVKNLDRIVGIPTAGIPIAVLVAFRLKKPFFYVRPKNRVHGKKRRVEGIIFPKDRVLLIDDIITTGKSIENFAKAIKKEGGLVSDVVVLLDREEGGKENLAKQNIKVHSLLRITEAIEKLHDLDILTEDQIKTILNHIKSG